MNSISAKYMYLPKMETFIKQLCNHYSNKTNLDNETSNYFPEGDIFDEFLNEYNIQLFKFEKK